MEKNSSVSKQWIFSFIASFPLFVYGTQNGWISPSIPILISTESPSGYPLTSFQISTIASSYSFFAVLSTNVYSFLTDKYGRRFALIFTIIPQILCGVIKLISANPIVLVLSQALGGIAGGGVFCVCTLYIKEISEDNLRGVLGAFGMLLQNVGIFVMYGLGGYLDYYLVLWISVWFPLLNLIAAYKLPESPAFLIKQGKIEEATAVLAYMKGVDENNKELKHDLAKIKTECEKSENITKVSFKSILMDKVSRKTLFLGTFALAMLDLNGVFAVFQYASVIIASAGVSIHPQLQSLLMPVFGMLGTMLSIILVERSGRKPLALLSIFGIAIAMVILATMILLQYLNIEALAFVSVACVIICVFFYGTLLPIPYTIMTEIFNTQIRATVLGYLVTFGWFLCFLQTVGFTVISEFLGMHNVFYIFSGFSFIMGVVCCIIMPETKGKSVEEIEKELGRK